MRIKKINYTYFAIIMFAAALLLLSIPIARVYDGNPAIAGTSHYENITQKTILLDFLLSFIPQIVLAVSFPLIIAIASLVLFTLLLIRYVDHEYQIYYALIILILTPTFIGLHTGLGNYQFILFFGLLFALLYSKKSPWFYVPLALLFVIDPLLSAMITVGLIVISFIDSNKNQSIVLSVFLLAMMLISSFFLEISFSFSAIELSFDTLFSFFNASYGYSLFLFILGLGGLFFERKRSIPLIIFIISLFYEPLRILGIVLLSFYAAKTFYTLQTRTWTINFIANLTLVLFISILLFSSSTFIKESIQDNPHSEHVDALVFLEEVESGARVLSSQELSSFITFMTGQEVVTSPNYYYSQNFEYIKQEFILEDIGYVLIDSAMRDGGIWQHDEEGLLFLLKYNDNFRKVYENQGVEIYYFPLWRE